MVCSQNLQKWYLGPNGGMYYGASGFNPGEFGQTFSDDVHEIQQSFLPVAHLPIVAEAVWRRRKCQWQIWRRRRQ